MICVCVGETTVEASLRALRSVPFGEVRLDLIEDVESGLERLFAAQGRRIATCRPGRFNEAEREALLLRALAAGAAMADVEIEAPVAMRRRIARVTRALGRELILSFHDFDRTPSRAELERMVKRIFAAGADLAKVACRVETKADAARLLGLLESGRPIVVAGMGDEGRLVRAAAPLLGSPFTYAAPDRGRATAPGQSRARALSRAIEALRRAAERGR